ncbi:GntR family transcriptional regulator [Natronospora cellulosivora (SeqCode)]
MWYYVDPQSGVPIYVQLKKQLKTSIANGLLKEGEKLPTVRELALELTINPNTVARVYKELERENVVRTERGRGTFVDVRTEKDSVEKERMLDELLEKLMVDIFQLGLESEKVKDAFLQKLGVWQERMDKGGGTDESGD